MEKNKNFYVLILTSGSQAFGGPTYGTKYDLINACKYCGTGAEAIGPRITSGLDKKRKGFFSNLDGELFVDLKLATAFSHLGLKNLEKVISPRGMVFPFMEIREEATLPPFSKETTGFIRENQCEHCYRDGHFNEVNEPLNLVYNSIDNDLLQKDFLKTYECFGRSFLRPPLKDSTFACPQCIVSERVIDLLKHEKVRRFTFFPIKILNFD